MNRYFQPRSLAWVALGGLLGYLAATSGVPASTSVSASPATQGSVDIEAPACSIGGACCDSGQTITDKINHRGQ